MSSVLTPLVLLLVPPMALLIALLSIAQSITQAHGGSIVMDTTAEGLTRITLRLPAT